MIRNWNRIYQEGVNIDSIWFRFLKSEGTIDQLHLINYIWSIWSIIFNQTWPKLILFNHNSAKHDMIWPKLDQTCSNYWIWRNLIQLNLTFNRMLFSRTTFSRMTWYTTAFSRITLSVAMWLRPCCYLPFCHFDECHSNKCYGASQRIAGSEFSYGFRNNFKIKKNF